MASQGNPFAVQPISGFTPGGMAAGGGYRSPFAFQPPAGASPGQPTGGGGFGGMAQQALGQMGGPVGLITGGLGGVGNYLQGKRNAENQKAMMEQQRLMGQQDWETWQLPAAHQQRQQYAGQQAFSHGMMGNFMPGGGAEGSFGGLRASLGDPFRYQGQDALAKQNPYNVPTAEVKGPSLVGSILGGLFG